MTAQRCRSIFVVGPASLTLVDGTPGLEAVWRARAPYTGVEFHIHAHGNVSAVIMRRAANGYFTMIAAVTAKRAHASGRAP